MIDALVIGAGPAGLATSRELSRRGIEHLVLERGAAVGHSWRNTYDSLKLHTGKHLSALPGLRFRGAVPLFPARDHFVGYLTDYAQKHECPVRLNMKVDRIERTDAWRVIAGETILDARVVIVATGIMPNPVEPAIPGRDQFSGSVLHSVEYRNPDRWRGQRVLVVGVGNSGGEIASELGRAGVDTTIAVRSGANVIPLTIAGLPSQYIGTLLRKLPRRAQEWVIARIRRRIDRKRPPVLPRPPHSPLDAIPLIGFHLVDAIAEGKVKVKGALDRFTVDGVRFADGSEAPFDAVILATGFRAALQAFNGSVKTDAKGFALRTDRVTSADFPGLYFVGHNYDSSGGLRNIAIDAPLAASAIQQYLARQKK